MIALQVFVIVGGVTRVIPLTGVTLPFVAYGGSSVVMNFVLIALLLVDLGARATPPGRAPALPQGRPGAGDPAAPSKYSVADHAAIVRHPTRAGEQRAAGARLRRALEEDLFVLHFQPIVSLADGARRRTTRRSCASPTSATGGSCRRRSSCAPRSATG